jgi:hypothetical protein
MPGNQPVWLVLMCETICPLPNTGNKKAPASMYLRRGFVFGGAVTLLSRTLLAVTMKRPERFIYMVSQGRFELPTFPLGV